MSGAPPPGSADKSLGDIVQEVSAKASLLVRDEIELAKSEVTVKVQRLGKGAALGAIAGVFALFALVLFLEGLAWFFNDLLDVGTELWIGFLIVVAILLALGGLAVFLAIRFFKRGAPPVPEMAIEEAKLTRQALENSRAGVMGRDADTSRVREDSGPATEVRAAEDA